MAKIPAILCMAYKTMTSSRYGGGFEEKRKKFCDVALFFRPPFYHVFARDPVFLVGRVSL